MKLEYRQLDRETFAALVQRAHRRLALLGVAALFAWLAPTAWLLLLRHLDHPLLDEVRRASWWPRVMPLYAVAIAVPLLVALVRLANDPRLKCPGCRKPLLPIRAVVMATGKCGQCGTRVLSGGAESAEAGRVPPPPPPPVAADASGAGKALLEPDAFRTLAPRRFQAANLVPAVVITVGLLAPALPVILFGESIRAATRPYPRAQPWLATGFIAYLAAVIACAAWVSSRISNDPRVRCPRCRKSLLRHQAVTIATGNCGHCGARALAPDADAHAG